MSESTKATIEILEHYHHNGGFYEIPVEIINTVEQELEEQYKEIERLNKKIEQYENPEDMTLMYMWCDEKAKDEIKRLNNIINELEKDLIEYFKKEYPDRKLEDYNLENCTYDYALVILGKLQELKGVDKK